MHADSHLPSLQAPAVSDSSSCLGRTSKMWVLVQEFVVLAVATAGDGLHPIARCDTAASVTEVTRASDEDEGLLTNIGFP